MYCNVLEHSYVMDTCMCIYYRIDVIISEEMNEGQWIQFTLIGVCVVFGLLRIIYPRMQQYKNIDSPNYANVLKYFVHSLDSISDILVCETMFKNNDLNYAYLSLIFIILPFILSITALFYVKNFMWSQDKDIDNVPVSQRITNYMSKYWFALLILVIFTCDFYNAIMIVQSRLFCLSILNLQLQKRERESLMLFKFICDTLCRSIPHTIIQVLYLQHVQSQEDDHVSLLLFLSLVFSVLSIVLGIAIAFVRLNNILISYSKHVRFVTNFHVKMQLNSRGLKWKHQFTHEKIADALSYVFRCNKFDHDDQIWADRSDVSVEFDVYYIDINANSLKLNNCNAYDLDVYFNAKLLCYQDNDNRIRNAFELAMNEFGTNDQCQAQKIFLSLMKNSLGLKKKARVGTRYDLTINNNTFDIFEIETIKQELESRLLSQLSIWRENVTSFYQRHIPALAVLQLPKQPAVRSTASIMMITAGADIDECENGNENGIELPIATNGNTINDQHQHDDADITKYNNAYGDGNGSITLSSHCSEGNELETNVNNNVDDDGAADTGIQMDMPKIGEMARVTGSLAQSVEGNDLKITSEGNRSHQV